MLFPQWIKAKGFLSDPLKGFHSLNKYWTVPENPVQEICSTLYSHEDAKFCYEIHCSMRMEKEKLRPAESWNKRNSGHQRGRSWELQERGLREKPAGGILPHHPSPPPLWFPEGCVPGGHPASSGDRYMSRASCILGTSHCVDSKVLAHPRLASTLSNQNH